MAFVAPEIKRYVAVDGERLAVHIGISAGEPRARAVFLHGISSHAGWYERGISHLSSAGIQTHFLDRRGSGSNAKDRGDVNRWNTWIEDVAIYLRQLRSERITPVVLCGISWGGKLAVAVARRHPELVGALCLICPGLYSPFEPGVFKRLALRTVFVGSMQRRKIAIPLRDPALFTDNLEWQRFISDDARTLREITLRFAREDRILTHYARSAASNLRMPVLLMLAGRDRIIDNDRVRRFFDRSPSTSKKLIEYPQSAHTLEFEPDPVFYFNDLRDWIVNTSAALDSHEERLV